MYAAVFATNPHASHKVGRGAHKPSVAVVVARTGFSAEVGGVHIAVHIVGKRLRSAATVGQAEAQHLLHKVGGACRNCGIGIHLIFIVVYRFFGAVGVRFHDAGHQHRVDVLAIVCHGAISVHQFEQVHVHRAEAHGRLVFVGFVGAQWRLDAHHLSGGAHIVEANAFAHTHSHNVDAACERLAETHLSACAATVGVAWRVVFHLAFALVIHVPVEHLVEFGVAWRESLLHGSGIYKEFECGAALSA